VTVAEAAKPNRASKSLGRVVVLAITVACFAFLYYRLNGAAARQGLPLTGYMAQVFANVRWGPWLLLMVAYSSLYFTIDTLVVTRALNWFIKPIRYRDIMPIRASAYILSLFSEQVGKGAMAYYLNKRDNVPGWEVASVMLFIMFGEVFYLLTWATVGYIVSRSSLPAVFALMPFISLAAVAVFAVWVLYFREPSFPPTSFARRRSFTLSGWRRSSTTRCSSCCARLPCWPRWWCTRSP
jgi:hypothetical protein